MAIWNNTVGFAAPFNPGVNVNPIDIRPFLDSTSGSGRSVSGNSGKSSGDSNKTVALYGTDLALQKEKQGVDMAESILEQQYSSAVNAKDATEESMQQAKMDYIKGMNELSNRKLQLSVAENQAKGVKEEYDATMNNININRKIGNKIAFASGNSIESGKSLFDNVEQLFMKDNGKGGFHTFNSWMDFADKYSGLASDKYNGNITSTKLTLPEMNYDNDEEAHKAIKDIFSNVGKTSNTGFISEDGVYTGANFTPDVLRALVSTDDKGSAKSTVSSDMKQLKETTDNVWEKIPQSTRNYYLGKTLGGNIDLGNGNQIQAQKAVAIIQDNKHKLQEMVDKGVDVKSKDYQTLYKQTTNLSNVVMANAKRYAIADATGQSIGLENYSSSLDINGIGGNDGSGSDKGKIGTPITAVMAGATKTPQTVIQLDPYSNSYVSWTVPDAATFNIHDAKPAIISKVLNASESDFREGKTTVKDLPNNLMINGVPISRRLFTDGKSDSDLNSMKIVGIHDTGYILPGYDTQPTDNNGYIRGTQLYSSFKGADGKTYSTLGKANGGYGYVELEMLVDGDQKIPIGSIGGRTFNKNSKVAFEDKTVEELSRQGADKHSNLKIVKDEKGKYRISVLAEIGNEHMNYNPSNDPDKSGWQGAFDNERTAQQIEGGRSIVAHNQEVARKQMAQYYQMKGKSAAIQNTVKGDIHIEGSNDEEVVSNLEKKGFFNGDNNTVLQKIYNLNVTSNELRNSILRKYTEMNQDKNSMTKQMYVNDRLR